MYWTGQGKGQDDATRKMISSHNPRKLGKRYTMKEKGFEKFGVATVGRLD
jgi:hypothetical protein